MATFLIAATGNNLAPAIYLTVIAAGALMAALSLPETSRKSLQADDADRHRSAETAPETAQH